MKKAANNVYSEGNSNQQYNNNYRGRGGRGRGRNNGRRGGKNWSWHHPNYNNNKRPFDAFTQAPDTQPQNKSQRTQNNAQGERNRPDTVDISTIDLRSV